MIEFDKGGWLPPALMKSPLYDWECLLNQELRCVRTDDVHERSVPVKARGLYHD